ncbi:MAG: UDP-N-acetylmuramoyl-tripeptide--D-alanyl-D-alanine ligase, partial [Acidimicrobiales bacterium]|nr:UDP-N-acetylmuramoyl-tripeptide--D-alanyl-D-alanine ligase [Acidimicrobiales bacterium]
MRFTTAEICAATNGDQFGRACEVEGVTIDSRQIDVGPAATAPLFVPIVAERDGHDFISAAVRSGVNAYLTSGPIEAGTAIRVQDTALALTALGAHARDRLPDRVVGVTGSVGKTSLKDLLRSAGATTWRTWANPGSFNNELGVPITLANAPDDSELVVVEMGARGVGHIAELCDFARPTVGIVTVVAGAHLEQFGDLDGVAAAKSELIRALPDDGIAVLNADDDRVAAMASMAPCRVVTFGVGDGDVRATGIDLDSDLRARFRLTSPWGEVDVHLGVAGAHQVTNALGAAAAALAMGATPEAVAEGLAVSSLSDHRMKLLESPGGFRVLDDSYNANPTSMRAALEALAALETGRRFAVLGTMAELGDAGEAAHQEMAQAADELGIVVVTVAEPAYRVTG